MSEGGRIMWSEHLASGQKDGWGGEGTGSGFAEQGYFPCVHHVAANRWNGMMVCAACVQEGRVPIPNPEAPPEPKPERELELERVVAEKLRLEGEREALRREQIDWAVRCGDVARAAALGAGERALDEAAANAKGGAGPIPAPTAAGTVEGVSLGAGRGVAVEGPGENVAGTGNSPRRPAPGVVAPDEERVAALSALAATAADELFRVVGVDRP